MAFPGEIKFERYRDEASTLPGVIFSQAQFHGDANFGRTRFDGSTHFEKAQFSGHATFTKAKFGGGAVFYKAQFSSFAWFREAHFGGDAEFYEARFSRHAFFDEARFRNAYFNKAQFGSTASFDEAQFHGAADFSGAVALGDGGNGGEARGLGDRFYFVSFAGARFSDLGYVRFTNRRFLEKTDFTRTVFGRAPAFHNCVLHQDTDFTGAEFPDRSGEAAPAYRTLKLAMEQARAGDEQAMFYALEMESRRKRKDTPISVKVFSRLYERAADYGRSFTRPLGWLGWTAGVFFLAYLICFAALTTGGLGEQDVWDVGRFTMRQIVRPFDALALGTTEGLPAGLSRLPLWLGFVAMIQSILSLGLIALFILALRRRFRMG